MIFYLSPEGRCGVRYYIGGRWRTTNNPEIGTISYEDLFRAESLAVGTYIFSGIEQLTPAGKELAELTWETLSKAGQKVLNRPSSMYSRHGLLQLMHQSGVNDFRSFTPDHLPADIRFPVFVREAEQHDGNMSPLIESHGELVTFLRWTKLRGYRADELLIIEFCDTSNEQGEFRKYSAQIVDGVIAARFLNIDQYWMVKTHGKVYKEEWAAEEFAYLRDNPHAASLKPIFDMARVDYGRIDYSILDGRVQVWEINTNPTIGGSPPSPDKKKTPEWIREIQKPGKQVHFNNFQSMLEAVDTPANHEVSLPLQLPVSVLKSWQQEVAATRKALRRREFIGKLADWPAVRQARNVAKRVLGIA